MKHAPRSPLASGRAAPPAAPERFATPGVVTIEALERPPYAVPAGQQLKTLVYAAGERLILAVVRGDHELNEAKLQTATGASAVRPARPDEIPGPAW